MVLDVGSKMNKNLSDAQRALIVHVTLKVWLFWPCQLSCQVSPSA